MDKKIAITIDELEISYKTLKPYSIKKNFFTKKHEKNDVFKAVDNISFKVEHGEILGIVGKNGSGKSTLLRAIGGIFSPDKGSVDLHDNSVSLSAIGVGFQKELTGRENIVLAGMLLGFSEDEIKNKMKSIIDFAAIGNFIDKPVRTYSSGMYSKLAFSITAVLETDIILIDEVLSVGDQKFKKKSKNKMLELIHDENRTVIIVSHNLETIKELCDRVIWIDGGKIKMEGKSEQVLTKYKEWMDQ
ncbi:MAG: ABC transporter ATP-binding protein [Sphaerochaeta sp.]